MGNFFPYFCNMLMLCFLISALLVKNPVYALLSLVGVVINMAMILIYMMADFLGFLLIVVYAGGVAVLFLFVVMMVNYKASLTARRSVTNFWPVILMLIVGLAYEMIRILLLFFREISHGKIVTRDINFTTMQSIAEKCYLEYANELIITGVILLLGVMGAVIMTLRYVKAVPKRIPVSEQVAREKSVSVEYPEIGTGVS